MIKDFFEAQYLGVALAQQWRQSELDRHRRAVQAQACQQLAGAWRLLATVAEPELEYDRCLSEADEAEQYAAELRKP